MSTRALEKQALARHEVVSQSPGVSQPAKLIPVADIIDCSAAEASSYATIISVLYGLEFSFLYGYVYSMHAVI